MSANPPAPSPHRFAILMSPSGRFLECLNCRLTIAFPYGALYDTVARQFESHSCAPFPSKEDDAPRQ
jgi:hypothetical protein